MYLIGVDKCALEITDLISRNKSEDVIEKWKDSLIFEIDNCYKIIKEDFEKNELNKEESLDLIQILNSTIKEFSLKKEEIKEEEFLNIKNEISYDR